MNIYRNISKGRQSFNSRSSNVDSRTSYIFSKQCNIHVPVSVVLTYSLVIKWLYYAAFSSSQITFIKVTSFNDYM